MYTQTPRIQFAGQSLSIISVLNLRTAAAKRYAEDAAINASLEGSVIKVLDKSTGHTTFSYVRHTDGVRVQITWQHDAVAHTVTRIYRAWNRDGSLQPANRRYDWMNREYPDQVLADQLSKQLSDFTDLQ
jgi:hypothetical protein